MPCRWSSSGRCRVMLKILIASTANLKVHFYGHPCCNNFGPDLMRNLTILGLMWIKVTEHVFVINWHFTNLVHATIASFTPLLSWLKGDQPKQPPAKKRRTIFRRLLSLPERVSLLQTKASGTNNGKSTFRRKFSYDDWIAVVQIPLTCIRKRLLKK